MLDRTTRHQLAEFFAPLMEDERRRKALVTVALGSDAAVKFGIEWSGDPRTFTIELVNRLAQTTTGVMPDEPPLLALLEECRPDVGSDQWPRIDALCRTLRPQPSQPVWPGSPYPGLTAFTEPQAPIFFGRGSPRQSPAHPPRLLRFSGGPVLPHLSGCAADDWPLR